MPLEGTDSAGIEVLVVDDEPGFADVTAEMLERNHPELRVRTATDPERALDRLDHDIDCVVSDYEMPGMNGVEFLEAVRSVYPNLPFILFTGKGSETIASEAISAGVTDYLQKSGTADQYDILTKRILNAVEKQRAQHRVRQSLEAIETATAGISLLDEDGEFVYVNEAYANIFGYDREELLGRHWEIIYREEDVDEVYESILPKARDGVWHGESVHRNKHGDTIVTDHTLTHTEDGTLVCTVEDITEEKRVTDELKLKERAMDAAPVGITIADATQDDEPLIYANDGFVELTGYSEGEILGENCRFLQGEDTTEEPVGELRAAIENNEPVTVELRNYRKDGTEFWNRVSIAPIWNEEGDVTHYIGCQEDVSERKKAEQEANALLEQFEAFGSVLSHDLQKPLSKVRSRIKLARQTEDWGEIDNADEDLGRLKNLICDFAQVMREGEIVNDTQEVDLETVCDSAWTIAAPPDADLQVIDVPEVTADEKALRRMLENLFQNACEHGAPNVRVRVGELPNGFYIADDGPGIPEDQCREIFDPGYTTTEDGSGMGLASVRQIAIAHGWKISVTESQWGGARFEITTRTESAKPEPGAERITTSLS